MCMKFCKKCCCMVVFAVMVGGVIYYLKCKDASGKEKGRILEEEAKAKREKLKDGVQDFRDAMSVHPDHFRVLSHGFRRKIAVCKHNAVTVSHLTKYL